MTEMNITDDQVRDLCMAVNGIIGGEHQCVMVVVNTEGQVRVISSFRDPATTLDLLAFTAANGADNYGQTEIKVRPDA